MIFFSSYTRHCFPNSITTSLKRPLSRRTETIEFKTGGNGFLWRSAEELKDRKPKVPGKKDSNNVAIQIRNKYDVFLQDKYDDMSGILSSIRSERKKLFHLPPIRFHCVGGCWDRIEPRIVASLRWQSGALKPLG
jgi:hypothetical protein